MSPQLAFGYMRINSKDSGARQVILRRQLDDCAEKMGYVLSKVFIDADDNAISVYADLIAEVCASEIAVVLVPSLDHFGQLTGVRTAMRERIEYETGARVITVSECRPGTTPSV